MQDQHYVLHAYIRCFQMYGPGIRGTHLVSPMQMKKRRNHLNGYFGQFDSKNRVKGPKLV